MACYLKMNIALQSAAEKVLAGHCHLLLPGWTFTREAPSPAVFLGLLVLAIAFLSIYLQVDLKKYFILRNVFTVKTIKKFINSEY